MNLDHSQSQFTPRAQKVLALAAEQRKRLGHSLVGPEHLLLGLIVLGQGAAVNVLRAQGLNLEKVRAELQKNIGIRPGAMLRPAGPLYTPQTLQVLAFARVEADALGHTYVGTEHLLLGLLRVGDDAASRVLTHFQVDSAKAREQILEQLMPDWMQRARHAVPVLEHSARVKQAIVTLDMEGVLTPEIWIAVAEKTGIPELRRTTRDEPDYDKLMRYRIEILDRHGIKLSTIQEVIGTLQPLPGGKEFLDALRSQVQVIILSDTFEQFAQPLMRQLGWPTLFCHRLIVENDRIAGYQLRQPNQKQKSVAALKSLNYHVISAGDSYNDTAMLCEANVGFLIHAPANVKAEFPQFPAVESHAELLKLIRAAMAQ